MGAAAMAFFSVATASSMRSRPASSVPRFTRARATFGAGASKRRPRSPVWALIFKAVAHIKHRAAHEVIMRAFTSVTLLYSKLHVLGGKNSYPDSRLYASPGHERYGFHTSLNSPVIFF